MHPWTVGRPLGSGWTTPVGERMIGGQHQWAGTALTAPPRHRRYELPCVLSVALRASA